MNASGEEELVGLSCLPSQAKQQSPQAINNYGVAILVGEVTEKGTGIGIERIDVSIAEISDQQVMTEYAKGTTCKSQAPWRVQLPLCYQPLDEMAIGIEDIDEPTAQTRDITILLCILFGIRDIELAADSIDAKRRVSCGEVRIGEGA